MSLITGRVINGLTRTALCRGLVHHHAGRSSVRPLTVSSHRQVKTGDEDVDEKPIKFSTSKASHRVWKTKRAVMYDQGWPWWKVLPLSVTLFSFLAWCALREEKDIDLELKKNLYERLPGLLPDEEEQVQNKPS